MPYIPTEEFLDQLIASCNQQMATFLQTLKETGARPGEAWKLEWDDIDIEGKKLNISHPEKGCNPRIRPIWEPNCFACCSPYLKPKKGFSYTSPETSQVKPSEKCARKPYENSAIQNSARLTSTLSAIGAQQWEYRRYHDFGCVMVLLGHKSLRYVLLYAQLSDAYSGNEAYVCKEAHTRQKAKHGDLFLRHTKNCYISIVPKELVQQITQSSEVSYSAIRKRLTRKKQALRIKEQRSYFATYLRTHGILAEYVDLIQGRIPKSVFARHYLKVEDLKELVRQVLTVTENLESSLLS